MSKYVNVIAMVKGEQRYIFLYATNSKPNCCVCSAGWPDPELDFSWYDAALCSKRVRSEASKLPASKDSRCSTDSGLHPIARLPRIQIDRADG